MIGSLQAAIYARGHPCVLARTSILPRYRFCQIRRRIMHLGGDLLPGIDDDRLHPVEASSSSGNISRKRHRRQVKGERWLHAGCSSKNVAIAITRGHKEKDPKRDVLASVGASQSDLTVQAHRLDSEGVENSLQDTKDWCAYCLISANRDRTYVGVTSNCNRRYLMGRWSLTW
eukprot:c19414_g1_i2 orf=832-1350(-)